MVNVLTTTMGKVIKISAENYSLLKHTKHVMELNSFDEVISKLLNEHRKNEAIGNE